MKNDALGARMKENYEQITRTYLPRRTYTIIRLDGKAFHTYTKGLQRPFDAGLMEDMQGTTIRLCEEVEGVFCGYTQSDEISLLLSDFHNTETQAWFKGNVQKIVSVSASIATAYFNHARLCREVLPLIRGEITENMKNDGKFAYFDSRAFTIPDPVEVENYLIWRQNDCTRNAIQMAAQAIYSHKQLHGKGWNELNEMLFQKGINFNDYTSQEKRGSLIVKYYHPMVVFDRKLNKEIDIVRSKWEVMPETPMFTSEEGRRFLKALVPTY